MFPPLRSSLSGSAATSTSSAPLFWFGSDSKLTRFLARFMLTTWMLPLLFAIFAAFPATPAQAQTTQQTVVVLDFAVAPGLDPLLGRKAADGLAVELQRSGDFEVVPRARVEEVVAQRAGLQPPFNDTAQILLAQAVNASSIFSGRVIGVDVRAGREARVVVESRQLDAATGDFINGTQVSETSEQKLQSVANEILIDEALNKAVFSAVRQMRQTSLPQGNVLNTTTEDVELSIGSSRGVARGQKYSVLRDVFNSAKRVTERTKIGEVTISRVESDQSVARLSAGGQQGVLTGDIVRRIFVPGAYPTSTFSSSSNSSSPVTSRPVTRVGGDQGGGGIGGFVQKSGRGVLGLLGLGLLVGLAGFGGGSGGGAPDILRQPREANPDGVYPRATFRFTSGIDGISTSVDRAQQEAVIAYLVFRGTSPAFSPDIRNLQEVIDARFVGARTSIPFTDLQTNSNTVAGIDRTQRVTITSNTTGGTDIGSVNLTITDIDLIAGNTLIQTPGALTITYTPQSYNFGESYFYSVGRVTAERIRRSGTGTGGTGGGTGTTTTVTIQPVRSPVGGQSGRYTPLFRPQILDTTEDTDNFTVQVTTDLTAFDPFVAGGGFIIGTNNPALDYTLLPGANVTTGADQFRVEVGRTQTFDRASTFISPNLAPPPNVGPGGTAQFNLGGIVIPDLNGEPYRPGQTLFVRVLSRNSNDIVEQFRISPTVSFVEDPNTTTTLAASRFLATPSSKRGAGVGLGRIGGAARSAASGAYTAPRVLQPRR